MYADKFYIQTFYKYRRVRVCVYLLHTEVAQLKQAKLHSRQDKVAVFAGSLHCLQMSGFALIDMLTSLDSDAGFSRMRLRRV